MKYTFFILLLLSAITCQKKCDESDDWCAIELHPNIPPALPWNVVNTIELYCDNNGDVSWVGPNYYMFRFSNTGPGYTDIEHDIFEQNIADYQSWLRYDEPDTPRKFYFRYVGPLPLFDTSRIINRGPWDVS